MPIFRQAAKAGKLAIALTTASLIGTPAMAATDEAPVEVRTDDLDLASESGQRSLDARLKIAARQVCGAAGDFKEVRDVATCRAQALAAVADDVEVAVARASSEALSRQADASATSRPDVRSASILIRAPSHGGK